MSRNLHSQNWQYFGRKAAEDQRDAMDNGELTYEGHNHFSVAEILFRINDQLEYLGTDVEKFSEKVMAKKVIAKTLHPVERLKYIRRGSKESTSKQAILACVLDMQDFLNDRNRQEQKVPTTQQQQLSQ
jgi:predicted nucleotidyltransferase